MRAIFVAFGFLALVACAQSQEDGRWRLAAEDSRISFVSIKAGDFAENHYFETISGEVASDGAAKIEIALESVETKLDIRNERMRDILFEVASYPTATVTAQVALDAFETLSVGARQPHMIDLTLTLHGVDIEAPANVFVTRLGEDRVSVETVEPVLLHAEDFGFGAALDELKEIAGLTSISRAVPVTASLIFER